MNFASSFVLFFIVISDYGFNLSAAREISINSNNRDSYSKIYWSVYVVKFALLLICLTLFLIIVFNIPYFTNNYLVYLLSFLSAFGVVLFPHWFFQGMEKLKYAAIINLIFKSIYAVLVFILIKDHDDLLVLITLNGVTFIAIGIVSQFAAISRFKIEFKFPSIEEIINQWKNGWYLFVSNISISLYTNSSTFLLGLLASQEAVGYFSAADKIRQAIQQIFNNITQVYYPQFAVVFKKSVQEGISMARRMVFQLGSVAFVISFVIFIFSEQISDLLFGGLYTRTVVVLKIISFLPFIIFLSNISGIQVMVNSGYAKVFSKLLLSAGFLNLLLLFLTVPYLFEVGTAVSVLCTEIFVTTSTFYFLKKNNADLLVYEKI